MMIRLTHVESGQGTKLYMFPVVINEEGVKNVYPFIIYKKHTLSIM